MNRRLYLILMTSVCLGSMILFAALHRADEWLSHELTRITPENQQILKDYALSAQRFYKQGDKASLQLLIDTIELQHQTWAAVITDHLSPAMGTDVPEHYLPQLSFQRKLNWPVHDRWSEVLIGIPFDDNGASFVILLPQAMHPRPNLVFSHLVITVLIPLVILLAFTHWFYRYLINPINILRRASDDLAMKERADPVRPQLGKRQDELTELAETFDFMADRIQTLVASQRQLIGDLSHELRTPLTRMKLALEGDLTEPDKNKRIQREIQLTNQLVEDAMTLAWLDSEHLHNRPQPHGLPQHLREDFSLSVLLDLICEDAGFEFGDDKIIRCYPDNLFLSGSNSLALSQSIENIIRNGLLHSPEQGVLTVTAVQLETDIIEQVSTACQHAESGCPQPCGQSSVCVRDRSILIQVQDQGPGVPDDKLEQIFQPFYRLDKARMRQKGGFGLGLALARKQIERLGGSIHARNASQGGLLMCLKIPVTAPAPPSTPGIIVSDAYRTESTPLREPI